MENLRWRQTHLHFFFFFNFAKVASYPAYQNFIIRKKFKALFLKYKRLRWLTTVFPRLRSARYNSPPEEMKSWSQGWLKAAGAYPGFCSMKRLEVFLLPLDGTLVHRRSLLRSFVTFAQQFTGTHLYTWVERGIVRVKCLAQEHNAVSPARGPLALESSALTMRPLRLPHQLPDRRQLNRASKNGASKSKEERKHI